MKESSALDRLRYPIGHPATGPVNRAERSTKVSDLRELPRNLGLALRGLNDGQLDTPYREGGWTVRQVAHHVADSHMNAYVRMRLALTEEWPAILAYDESAWAELEDARRLPVEVSLALLGSLHQRWVVLLESLHGAQWERGYVHPQLGRQSIEQAVALYSWHSRHHTAHVTELRKRRGWELDVIPDPMTSDF